VVEGKGGRDLLVPGKDDDACRATAERINRDHPEWLVMYGSYSRVYWAYPLFEMRRRLIVHAAYPDALIARMNEVEQRFRISPEHEG
jgi:hypothetical protein